MRTGRDQQPLSYDVRLPDEAQADTLRLLDVTRQVVNAALVLLWPHLDEFMQERSGDGWTHHACTGRAQTGLSNDSAHPHR